MHQTGLSACRGSPQRRAKRLLEIAIYANSGIVDVFAETAASCEGAPLYGSLCVAHKQRLKVHLIQFVIR
jgi:hypothetical protein